jgi:hypothetical protein
LKREDVEKGIIGKVVELPYLPLKWEKPKGNKAIILRLVNEKAVTNMKWMKFILYSQPN